MIRAFFVLIGLLFVLVGMVLVPLPVPLGALLIAVGLGVLLTWSVTARRLMRKTRRRNPRLNGWIRSFEDNLPSRLGKLLRKTAPRRGKVFRAD